MTPFNPDDWMDVIALIGLGMCPVLAAVIPVWLKLRDVKEQVCNNHDENLRDEITRGFAEIRKDIGGLREELRTERKERMEGDQMLRLVTGVGS
ncbi:minor tail protein [Mycobacterium phage Astro]|uniref:Minor tail subunit n=2 Tax=Fromanvirus astro TaxID=1195075 RepID=I6S378_9CAUD|nr:minor tail protein [Mycobacterium phage Astro]AFM54992.1 minor tail subunit [Mycobacterium phage Astro]QDH92981.1 membrane protein [Mycobacterium phage Stephig9]